MKQPQQPRHHGGRHTSNGTREATGGAHEQGSLRMKAREALRTGRLPDRDPDQTWGGPGSGIECAVCDSPVAQNEMEIEIEFSGGDGRFPTGTYRVHTHCFDAWESERHRTTAATTTAPRNSRSSLGRA